MVIIKKIRDIWTSVDKNLPAYGEVTGSVRIWEDSTCPGATKPPAVRPHWASRAHELELMNLYASTTTIHGSPHITTTEPTCSNY